MTTVDCHWEKDETELQKPCTFGKEKVIDVDFEEAFGDVELVQIFAQNGLLSWLFARPKYADHLTSIGLTKDNAYSCLSNFIFQAAPKLQAQLPRPVLQALQDNIVIGIQIRYVLQLSCLAFSYKLSIMQSVLACISTVCVANKLVSYSCEKLSRFCPWGYFVWELRVSTMRSTNLFKLTRASSIGFDQNLCGAGCASETSSSFC